MSLWIRMNWVSKIAEIAKSEDDRPVFMLNLNKYFDRSGFINRDENIKSTLNQFIIFANVFCSSSPEGYDEQKSSRSNRQICPKGADVRQYAFFNRPLFKPRPYAF